MQRHRLTILSCALALTVAVIYVAAVGADAPATAPANDQLAGITKTAEAFVDAFGKGDAKAIAAFWAPDADYFDLDGRHFKGRDAIAAEFTELFAGNKGLSLRIEVHSVRFPTPDTAIESGVTSVLDTNGSMPNRARYTNFLVRKDGKWLLSSVLETPYLPPNNYEQLRAIDWIIGEWVQDVKEGHVARVAFDWTPDQNFILGFRAVGVKDMLLDNGTQRIGWDPAAKLIRCWNFESDGGFGEGSWKKDGDKWIVSMSAVLRSGSLMVSSTVITRVDPDTVTFQTINQKLDGQPLPNSPVITMKRAK